MEELILSILAIMLTGALSVGALTIKNAEKLKFIVMLIKNLDGRIIELDDRLDRIESLCDKR